MSYFSKHTFMFPFRWAYIKHKKRNYYNDTTDLKDFHRLFEAADNGFSLKKFKMDNHADKYNEYVYFHPFARKALYYTDDNTLMRYYEIDMPQGYYHIEYLKENKATNNFDAHVLELKLDSVCMHVYETGVGVVAFNLTNCKYDRKEDILLINEFGRRLYPQFMEDEDRLMAKKVFLPNRIWGKIGNYQFDEDFSAYQLPIRTDNVFFPPDHIKKVFGYKGKEQMGDQGQKFIFTKQDEQKDTIRIRQITDDRMFFLSWYGNNEIAQSLSKRILIDKEKEVIKQKKQHGEKICNKEHFIASLSKDIYEYEIDDFWYAFAFGDKGGPSVENIEMQHEHTRRFTYTRWLNYGSLFGLTRDSFVSISSDRKTLKDVNAPLLDEHMQTMYYQMAILCLVQRASILRFSWEISQITNDIFADGIKPEKAIRELYENYIRFINQIYFREVSSQIQAIEIYDMFQKAMNLEKEVKDLDSEMQELFNYLSVKEQTGLARVADLFLPVTLLAGVLGVNSISDEWFKESLLSEIINWVLIAWVLYVFGKQIYNKLKK